MTPNINIVVDRFYISNSCVYNVIACATICVYTIYGYFDFDRIQNSVRTNKPIAQSYMSLNIKKNTY